MRISSTILVILCLSLLSPITFAWNTLGHMVVASIAYQNLKPSIRKTVDDMVPYLNSAYPDMKTFINLSYWPDTLRNQKINNYTRWHFIDIPFTNDNSPLVNTITDDNVVWAIDNVQVVVGNSFANPYERARFLSFLIHFVGDIHQPLHTSTYISARHRTGDKGGNLFYVYYYNKRMKLHELWDSGFGSFESEPTLSNAMTIAKRIMALHPVNEFTSRVNNLSPNNWAQEGFNIAKKYVYVTPEDQPVSGKYIATGKQKVEEQAALAGYRLAAILNQVLN